MSVIIFFSASNWFFA